MRIQPTPFRCLAGPHDFIGELLMDAPITAALAAMRAVRCPECGAGSEKIVFRNRGTQEIS